LRLWKVDYKYLEFLNYDPREECRDGPILCEYKYFIGRRKEGIPYKE
jgi:hypothetical protein